jgi:hypothetical protein
MAAKNFKLRADQIQTLTDCNGGCFATDHITVEGRRVGYMYREEPDGDWDTGWRFFSGYESDDYVNYPDNVEIYQVNTIANYDPDIIPFLNSPVNSAFGRDKKTGLFVEEE